MCTGTGVLQQFPFAFSISRKDFPGIPEFPSRLIPPFTN